MVEEIAIKADFTRVAETLFCREPDKVPIFDGWIDEELKETFLGRKVESLKDDVEFFLKAGYDFYHIHVDLKEMINFEWKKSRTDILYRERKTSRSWAPEHTGVISNRNEVKRRIAKIAPGGGYCVGSSNSVINYVPLENYMTMNEATFKYGTYPIKI